jgi:transposase
MNGKALFARPAFDQSKDRSTREEVAEACDDVSSVGRFLRRWRVTGSVSPAKFGGYKPYALEGHEQQIKQWVAEQPDITLAELRIRLTKKKILIGKSSIARFLDHLGLTFKKKSARSRTGSTRRGRSP